MKSSGPRTLELVEHVGGFVEIAKNYIGNQTEAKRISDRLNSNWNKFLEVAESLIDLVYALTDDDLKRLIKEKSTHPFFWNYLFSFSYMHFPESSQELQWQGSLGSRKEYAIDRIVESDIDLRLADLYQLVAFSNLISFKSDEQISRALHRVFRYHKMAKLGSFHAQLNSITLFLKQISQQLEILPASRPERSQLSNMNSLIQKISETLRS